MTDEQREACVRHVADALVTAAFTDPPLAGEGRDTYITRVARAALDAAEPYIQQRTVQAAKDGYHAGYGAAVLKHREEINALSVYTATQPFLIGQVYRVEDVRKVVGE